MVRSRGYPSGAGSPARRAHHFVSVHRERMPVGPPRSNYTAGSCDPGYHYAIHTFLMTSSRIRVRSPSNVTTASGSLGSGVEPAPWQPHGCLNRVPWSKKTAVSKRARPSSYSTPAPWPPGRCYLDALRWRTGIQLTTAGGKAPRARFL